MHLHVRGNPHDFFHPRGSTATFVSKLSFDSRGIYRVYVIANPVQLSRLNRVSLV